MAKRGKPSLPYEHATSGKRAILDIDRTLKAFGASKSGTAEDFEHGEAIVQFEWRQHHVLLRASAKGYAAVWLRENPHHNLMRTTKVDHERRALEIGKTAVWSMLRDWIKGQVTAVQCGMLSFEGAFLGSILLGNGETVLERIGRENLLPLPPPAH